jgi:hypothetical protein
VVVDPGLCPDPLAADRGSATTRRYAHHRLIDPGSEQLRDARTLSTGVSANPRCVRIQTFTTLPGRLILSINAANTTTEPKLERTLRRVRRGAPRHHHRPRPELNALPQTRDHERPHPSSTGPSNMSTGQPAGSQIQIAQSTGTIRSHRKTSQGNPDTSPAAPNKLKGHHPRATEHSATIVHHLGLFCFVAIAQP